MKRGMEGRGEAGEEGSVKQVKVLSCNLTAFL